MFEAGEAAPDGIGFEGESGDTGKSHGKPDGSNARLASERFLLRGLYRCGGTKHKYLSCLENIPICLSRECLRLLRN